MIMKRLSLFASFLALSVGEPSLFPRACAGETALTEAQKQEVEKLRQELWEQGSSDEEIAKAVEAKIAQLSRPSPPVPSVPSGPPAPSGKPDRNPATPEEFYRAYQDCLKRLVEMGALSPDQGRQNSGGLAGMWEGTAGKPFQRLMVLKEARVKIESTYRAWLDRNGIRGAEADRKVAELLPAKGEAPAQAEAPSRPTGPSAEDGGFGDDEVDDLADELLQELSEEELRAP